MGEAKRRGTFEDRRTEAVLSENALLMRALKHYDGISGPSVFDRRNRRWSLARLKRLVANNPDIIKMPRLSRKALAGWE